MKELLKKVDVILEKTDDFESFKDEYYENLRMHGERLADGAVFFFDLGDNYSLVITFTDYLFENFSIIHRSLNSDMLFDISLFYR